jgi:predicted ester cyclase
LEDFKKWVGEDLSAFSDMRITILDEIEEQNKVAIRWTLKATHEQDFAGMLPVTRRLKLRERRFFILKKTKSRKDGLYLIWLN